MQPCVYILASRRNGTLYTGVTSDLSRRASEHRRDIIDGFSKRYGVHKLVYVEFHSTMAEAILREKLMPSFPRKRESRAPKTAAVAPCSSQGQALDPRCRG